MQPAFHQNNFPADILAVDSRHGIRRIFYKEISGGTFARRKVFKFQKRIFRRSLEYASKRFAMERARAVSAERFEMSARPVADMFREAVLRVDFAHFLHQIVAVGFG